MLFLGLTRLFTYLCQYILLKAIKKQVLVLISQVVGFTDKIISSLNNVFKTWANGVNNIINIINTDINKNIFGWVNITTTVVNLILSEFMD